MDNRRFIRYFNTEPEEEWEEDWCLVNEDDLNSPHILRLIAIGENFELQFPPVSFDQELQVILSKAEVSMARILEQELVDADDVDGVDRLTEVMRRGGLLPKIRAYRQYYAQNPYSGRLPGVFAWNADAWGCTFYAAGDSRDLAWYPIYHPPPPPPESESESDDDDDNDDEQPGPSGAQDQESEDEDYGSSSQEARSKALKRGRDTDSDSDSDTESIPTKRRRPVVETDSDTD